MTFVACPHCGSEDTRHIEDAVLERGQPEIRDGKLYIDGYYTAWDEDNDGRLWCRDCGQDFPLPDMEIVWT